MPEPDLKSLRDLFLRSSRELLQVLTRRVGAQDAPDLVQETFFRFLRHAKSETIVEPHAFLHATAINLAKDHRRRARTEHIYVDFGDLPDGVAESLPLPDQEIVARQRLEHLKAAVAALPPRCRQVFIMRRIENLPQREIAKRLGISRSMVQQHLRLAMKRCHEALD
jgi:RNA polymerase sigma-70 factor (ECF subfamily)